MEQEENQEKGLRGSWARNHMGNPDQNQLPNEGHTHFQAPWHVVSNFPQIQENTFADSSTV